MDYEGEKRREEDKIGVGRRGEVRKRRGNFTLLKCANNLFVDCLSTHTVKPPI